MSAGYVIRLVSWVAAGIICVAILRSEGWFAYAHPWRAIGWALVTIAFAPVVGTIIVATWTAMHVIEPVGRWLGRPDA